MRNTKWFHRNVKEEKKTLVLLAVDDWNFQSSHHRVAPSLPWLFIAASVVDQ